MKLAGDYTFDASRQEVWQALLDPEVLANTLPGSQDLKEVGEHKYAGKLAMKVGPVQGIFEGTVKLTDLDPPNGYHLTLNGKGAPGFVSGRGSLKLEDKEDGTLLRYEVDTQVGGRIAGVGQRLLDSSAKVLTRQALEGLDQQIQARRAGSGEGATPAVTPPSQGAFAARFVGDLVGELVPKERRPLVVTGVIALIVVVVVVGLRTCG